MKVVGQQIEFGQIQLIVLVMGNILLYQYTGELWYCLFFSVALLVLLNLVPYTRGAYLPGIPVLWRERLIMETIDEENEPTDVELQDLQIVPNFISYINKVFKNDPVAIDLSDRIKEGKIELTTPFVEKVKAIAAEKGIQLDENGEVDLIVARRLDSPTPWRAALVAIVKSNRERKIDDYLTSYEGLIFKTRRMRGPRAYQAQFGSQESVASADLEFQTPSGTLKCAEAMIVVPPEPKPVPDEMVSGLKVNAFSISLIKSVIFELIKDRWADQHKLAQADAALQQNNALYDALTFVTGEKYQLGQAVATSRSETVEEIMGGKELPMPRRGFLSVPPSTLVMILFALGGALLGSLELVYRALGYTQLETVLIGGVIGLAVGFVATKVTGLAKG